jgi:hypothetical protein
MNSSNVTVNDKLKSDPVVSIHLDLSENQLYFIGCSLLFLLILVIVGCRLYHRRMKKNNTKIQSKTDEII